eukprot:482233-Amorphochlora_amoeboformis.AAC.1
MFQEDDKRPRAGIKDLQTWFPSEIPQNARDLMTKCLKWENGKVPHLHCSWPYTLTLTLTLQPKSKASEFVDVIERIISEEKAKLDSLLSEANFNGIS